MWFRGTNYGVGIWYICWGEKGSSYNAELYATPYGVRQWLTSKAMSEVPVHRIGRIVITEDGPVEKEHWDSREEFLEAPA